MNSPCAKCSKTVYPVEKLNLLDKVWHKGCFKCEICNLTLTLKTYKGYDKNPYCNVHYPVTKFTSVADTPESLRLKKVTENLSQVKYHKQFMESKGTKMSVADDPESLRTKRNQEILSQTKYHGKDRTNPSSTPLSRPSFSAPGYVINHKNQNGDANAAPVEGDQAIDDLPQPVAPEPEQAAEAKKPVQPEPVPAPAAAPAEPEIPPTEAASEPEPAAVPEPVPKPVEEPVVEPVAPVEAPKTGDDTLKYIAVYDYDANDEDEVSILEGDIVINGEIIAEGWMVGTNTRTGCHGMLPSNYVELVNATSTGGS